MPNLKQLIITTQAMSSGIEMSNEELVSEIQLLANSANPTDQKRLTTIQAKLFSQNAALVVKSASRYNRGKVLTPDETGEVAMAVFTAARKYDFSRGVPFSSCLPWHIQSALQHEHAFMANQSQSVYARAAAKVNNPSLYSVDEVKQAETALHHPTTLDMPSVVSRMTDNVSTEDLFISLTEQSADEDKRERMLQRSTEAIALLPPEQKQILATLLSPLNASDEFGLRSTAAIAKQLHTTEKYVEDQKQLMFGTIFDHIMEMEPSMRPVDWTPNQQGIQIPGIEGFLMGLFGTPTAGEIENYRKVTKKRYSRR